MKLRQRTSDDTLVQAVRASLARAEETEIRSLGFSLMGAGIGGMKAEKCARLMIRECTQHLKAQTSKLERIVFSALKARDAETLHSILHKD